MGAWWSAEEVETGVASSPSSCKTPSPQGVCHQVTTDVQLDGEPNPLVAFAMRDARPWRPPAGASVARDMGSVTCACESMQRPFACGVPMRI